MKNNYYKEKLNSQMLFQVYDTKIERIKSYLFHEIDRVRKDLTGKENLLEVGCGYGRILKELSKDAGFLKGIDISEDSIELGKDYLKDLKNVELEAIDINDLKAEDEFDVVISLQNGLSSLKTDPDKIIKICLKALKDKGRAYFSTYSGKFWEDRIKWFEEQAEKKLLGEIDYERTKDGVIYCKDGFKAVTFTEEDLRELGERSGYRYIIEEVDESSLFLIIDKIKR
ncbi:class I SAM-dependent methyltransferase [Peptoniphilus catoniae]|uniref:class I SAM-dependent methyltransferase n=1 Tax=Peptoniphilus catoniae TaxID=1660341 RepID=UPI0010FEF26F|nr:class I SAM-dependent methyltransferase [Peptoniphilus catoniae]